MKCTWIRYRCRYHDLYILGDVPQHVDHEGRHHHGEQTGHHVNNQPLGIAGVQPVKFLGHQLSAIRWYIYIYIYIYTIYILNVLSLYTIDIPNS